MIDLVGVQASLIAADGEVDAAALPPIVVHRLTAVSVVQVIEPPDIDDEPEDDDDAAAVVDGEPDLSHRWAIAAIALVDHKTAKHANLRGSFRTADRQRIEALETYCSACRRPFDDVSEKPCEAAINNTHLIGGDPGVRKKRLVYEPEGEVVAGPTVSRQGAQAFINGDGAPVG